MKKRISFIFTIKIAIVFALFFHFGCKQTDKSWHKYQNENFEVWGKDRGSVEIVTHGWKLIKKARPKNDFYEWGWEITIKINKSKDVTGSAIGIRGIEYTLFDSDRFKLTTSRLNSADYGRMVWDDVYKGPILQKVDSTKTYGQTGYVISQKAKSVSFGHCRVQLE
ncbi:MAG: hypothetical protein HKO68_18995 [Desulfobacterales bacterium]|nr:hypothetical protein [Deltaproteobacteria bacterium]NNL78422.1 hypothetical protein [Desulfobacterales bacterium]